MMGKYVKIDSEFDEQIFSRQVTSTFSGNHCYDKIKPHNDNDMQLNLTTKLIVRLLCHQFAIYF